MIKLFIFSFFFSSIFCDETSYQFINDVSKNEIMDIEVITDMSSGPYNYVSNFSGRIATEYIGNEDGNNNFMQTWSNIISTLKRNDQMKINHSVVGSL